LFLNKWSGLIKTEKQKVNNGTLTGHVYILATAVADDVVGFTFG